MADPLTDPAGFLADVATLVRAWRVDVLIPITEPALLAILPERERFGAVQIPFPDSETFRRVSDKALVLSKAPHFGIGVPEQRLLSCRDALPTVPLDALSFPLVIKPSRSVGESGAGRTKLATGYAADRAELETYLSGIDPRAYPLLLQRRLLGPGIGIFLLLWEGRIVAVFSHRRIREKPPSGGVSVYRESIEAEPELVARSRALLEHLGWQGVAMVEYKIDQTTGTPYLMEINGRFWGSLQLAIDSGVDFPTLLLSAAAGANPPAVRAYRVGVRSRWWWGDVDHLLSRLRSSRNGSEPPHAGGRLAAVRDFLTLWRPGDRNEILELSDPKPLIRETIDWFRGQ